MLERRLVAVTAVDAMLARNSGWNPRGRLSCLALRGRERPRLLRPWHPGWEWPFVEVFPARLAADQKGPAGALRDTFTRISDLDNVVVFIGRSRRNCCATRRRTSTALQGVTNELLEPIPMFRERPGRCDCGNQLIRALDDAFLRHGRFDYVIPIGLPDKAAREPSGVCHIPSGCSTVSIYPSWSSAPTGFHRQILSLQPERRPRTLSRALSMTMGCRCPQGPPLKTIWGLLVTPG